jgi:hypothetical protein
MFGDVLEGAAKALDRTFYALQYSGKVTTQNPDLSVNIQPDDVDIPPLANIGWRSPFIPVCVVGSPVWFAFDAKGQAWCLGPKGSGVGADFVPLGAAILAALNAWATAFNAHTHISAGSGSATQPPNDAFTSIPTSVLSTTAKVQP